MLTDCDDVTGHAFAHVVVRVDVHTVNHVLDEVVDVHGVGCCVYHKLSVEFCLVALQVYLKNKQFLD